MGLSTTGLGKESSTGLPKTISPGNHTVKLNSINLEEFSFIKGAYHLMLNVETEPIEGFEGFLIDKDNPDAGHYSGQVGRVKVSQYAFADGTTKSGIQIQRDKSILIFLQNFCKALDINSWFVDQDNKHDTIEEFVEAFNKEKPFNGIFFDICVAGKEYEGKSGYTNYDMWLPKSSKDGYAFAAKGGKVIPFDEQTHLIKMEVKKVDNFGDDDLDVPTRAASDFTLD